MAFTFPTPTPVFPTLRPGFPVHVRPTYSSIVQTSVSGVEQISAKQAYPLWEFEIMFELLADETQNIIKDASHFAVGKKELQEIAGLFLVCRGQYGRFFYKNPRDFRRLNQHIATGDGVRTVFRLMRTWSTWFIEPVGGIDMLDPINVYLDGVLQGPGVASIDADLINVVFTDPVPLGTIVTMDYSFYYFCRFIEDIQDFEQFFHHMWALQSCKFRSAKR